MIGFWATLSLNIPDFSRYARSQRDQVLGQALGLPLTWIEQRLSEDGLNIEQQVRLENQRRAEDQVSVANSISSLRFIHAMDWRIFVDTLSRVEAVLSLDPAAVYDQSDFTTRDRCRQPARPRTTSATTFRMTSTP